MLFTIENFLSNRCQHIPEAWLSTCITTTNTIISNYSSMKWYAYYTCCYLSATYIGLVKAILFSFVSDKDKFKSSCFFNKCKVVLRSETVEGQTS